MLKDLKLVFSTNTQTPIFVVRGFNIAHSKGFFLYFKAAELKKRLDTLWLLFK